MPGEEPDGTKDEAGFHVVAEALAGLGLNSASKTPFTIGVTGRYGAGKTKLLQQIREALRTHFEKKGITPYCVNFDVGRFHDVDDIRPRLLHAFFEAYEDRHGRLKATWFFFWAKVRSWDGFKSLLLAPMLAAMGLVAPLLPSGFPGVRALLRLPESVLSLAMAICLVVLVLAAIRAFRHPLLHDLLRGALCLPDTTGALGQKHNQETLLKGLVADLIQRMECPLRVFLFVDNLDRCPPARSLEIVDQIFSLMALEGVKEHLVTFVSVDKDFLRAAVSEREVDGQQYFEKLFSLEVRVPPIDTLNLRPFLRDVGLSSLSVPSPRRPDGGPSADTLDDVNLSHDEEECLAAAVQSWLGERPAALTPRRVIRLVFAYRFIKYVWARAKVHGSDPPRVLFVPDRMMTALLQKARGEEPHAEDEFTQRILDLVHLAGSPKQRDRDGQSDEPPRRSCPCCMCVGDGGCP